MNFFTYLRSVISEDSADSRHGFALVVSVMSLGLSTVLLAIAACFGQDVAIALGVVSTPLAGLGGFVYGKAKQTENATSVVNGS